MSEQVVDALAKSVLATDASRRVGWAKAYAAEEKLDEALRDSNIFRGDRDAYRRGLSFMYGLFTEWVVDEERTPVFAQVLEQVAGYDALLDYGVVAAGRSRARAIREADELAAEEAAMAREAKRQAKADRSKKAKNAWKQAGGFALVKLAARYGFKSVGEMHDVLTRWQTATGREPSIPNEVNRRTIEEEKSARLARKPLGGES